MSQRGAGQKAVVIMEREREENVLADTSEQLAHQFQVLRDAFISWKTPRCENKKSLKSVTQFSLEETRQRCWEATYVEICDTSEWENAKTTVAIGLISAWKFWLIYCIGTPFYIPELKCNK